MHVNLAVAVNVDAGHILGAQRRQRRTEPGPTDVCVYITCVRYR